MTGRDDEPDVRFVESGAAAPDTPHEHAELIEPGHRLDPRWRIAAAAVALLAIGGVVGYLSGKHAGRSASPVAPPASSAASSSAPATSGGPSATTRTSSVLGTTGARCSRQLGKQLELGLELLNDTARTITLTKVNASLPLGGLRLVDTARRTCGQLLSSANDKVASYRLAPGATAWVAITTDVLVTCPGPMPVHFEVSYTQGMSANVTTTDLGGFVDLGDVPYTGCATPH